MMPPDRADPYRSVFVDASGPRERDVVEGAIKQAAEFLQEDPEDLYAAEVSNIRALQRSRYRPHLGVQGKVVRWGATVKVRLKPEIVKARRGEPDETPDPRPPKGGLRLATRGGEPVTE